MSQNQVVTPVEGTGVPSGPQPANVPSAKRPFRNIGQTTSLTPVAPPQSYTKETGLPGILGAFGGYQESDHYDFRYSVFTPSALSLTAVWYLTCARLASHDRFLKDTVHWHPYMDLLYLYTLLWYHVLRVRRELGSLADGEHDFLATLEARYPPGSLHIPGNYVAIFMAITATESPYPWQSKIGPTLPNLVGSSQAMYHMQPNGMFNITANPILALDMVYQVATTRRTSADQEIVAPFANLFGDAFRSNRNNRFVFLTPIGRVGNPASIRAEDAFWYNNATPNTRAAGNPTISPAWDLPQRPVSGAGLNGLTMAQLMCLMDTPNVAVPVNRYRNWLNAYSATMNLQCQYVSGSRTLNDIATVGVGAHSTVWLYTPGSIITTLPAVAGNADWTAAQIEDARTATRLQRLEVDGTIRDPELSQAALQVSVFAQVNVSFGGQANAPPDNTVRDGPFWTSPQAASAPHVDIAPILHANVSNMISSVVRK